MKSSLTTLVVVTNPFIWLGVVLVVGLIPLLVVFYYLVHELELTKKSSLPPGGSKYTPRGENAPIPLDWDSVRSPILLPNRQVLDCPERRQLALASQDTEPSPNSPRKAKKTGKKGPKKHIPTRVNRRKGSVTS